MHLPIPPLRTWPRSFWVGLLCGGLLVGLLALFPLVRYQYVTVPQGIIRIDRLTQRAAGFTGAGWNQLGETPTPAEERTRQLEAKRLEMRAVAARECAQLFPVPQNIFDDAIHHRSPSTGISCSDVR